MKKWSREQISQQKKINENQKREFIKVNRKLSLKIVSGTFLNLMMRKEIYI